MWRRRQGRTCEMLIHKIFQCESEIVHRLTRASLFVFVITNMFDNLQACDVGIYNLLLFLLLFSCNQSMGNTSTSPVDGLFAGNVSDSFQMLYST